MQSFTRDNNFTINYVNKIIYGSFRYFVALQNHNQKCFCISCGLMLFYVDLHKLSRCTKIVFLVFLLLRVFLISALWMESLITSINIIKIIDLELHFL